MTTTSIDPDGESKDIQALRAATKVLLQFQPDSDIPPRLAYLLAEIFKSHVVQALYAAGSKPAEAHVDRHLLNLAHYVTGDDT